MSKYPTLYLKMAKTTILKRSNIMTSLSMITRSINNLSFWQAYVIQASVNPLKQECDDDAEEELDLRRDEDEREVMTCEVAGQVYWLTLKLLVGQER